MLTGDRTLMVRLVLCMAVAAVLGGASGQGCENTDNVTWYDQYPERPPIEVRPAAGLSANNPIEAEVNTSVAMAVYIQGGQPPYNVTFHFQDGTEPELTTALMDPTQTWQPVAGCTHRFAQSGLFIVAAAVRDAFERVAFADIYVKVTGEAATTQQPVDLSPFKSCTVTVVVRGHFREPPVYSWQGTANYDYDYVCADRWSGTSSFSGNTFTATWANRVDPLLGATENGELHVTVDPQTLEVISFSASRTETRAFEGTVSEVTTSSISGKEPCSIPKVGYFPPPEYTPLLNCSIVGQEACSQLGPRNYRVDRTPNEWYSPVPWTLLMGYDCGSMDDATPEITIVFEAE